MKRNFRLTRSTDFKRVRRFGKSYAHPLVVLIVYPNGLEQPRIGVSAGRSVGNAVQRNRAKRLIRAAMQPHLSEIKPGWDMTLIARQPLEQATFDEAHIALLSLLRRARLLQEMYVGPAQI